MATIFAKVFSFWTRLIHLDRFCMTSAEDCEFGALDRVLKRLLQNALCVNP